MRKLSLLSLIVLVLLLNGCNIADELENIGQPPAFTPMEDPFNKRPPSYTQHIPDGNPIHPQTLWAPGKKNFFRDQRANAAGDILTVRVDISGEIAKLDNKTERSRTSAENLAIKNFFGVLDPNLIGANPALNLSANPSFKGAGKVDRKEDVKVKISVVVKEVLPNGNLVIEGRQEVRLNFEIREIFISGIVRPQDISDNNEVEWDRIAEARIGYGGRGQITQFQQPSYGQQAMDILLPF